MWDLGANQAMSGFQCLSALRCNALLSRSRGLAARLGTKCFSCLISCLIFCLIQGMVGP